MKCKAVAIKISGFFLIQLAGKNSNSDIFQAYDPMTTEWQGLLCCLWSNSIWESCIIKTRSFDSELEEKTIPGYYSHIGWC